MGGFTFQTGDFQFNLVLKLYSTVWEAVLPDAKSSIGPLNPLVWGDKTFEYRSFSVCLGIAIDEKLSWANHVKSVSTSYSSKVKMLRCINFLWLLPP